MSQVKKVLPFQILMLLYTTGGQTTLYTLNPLKDINICSNSEHTERSFLFSQTLRVSRIYSREKDFRDHCLQMRLWFLMRKQPGKLIGNEMKKVRFFPINLQNKKREKGVPFVVTYHPILNSFIFLSVNHAVLVLLFLGLSIVAPNSSAFAVDFEQVNSVLIQLVFFQKF